MLCTSERTYAVHRAETSNTLVIVDASEFKATDADDEAGGLPRNIFSVQSVLGSHIEV